MPLKARGSLNYGTPCRSSQMNVEASSDVDHHSIISIQVRVGDVWVVDLKIDGLDRSSHSCDAGAESSQRMSKKSS